MSPRCDFATELSFLWTFYDFPTILQQFCIFVSVLLCSLRFSHKFGFFVLVLQFSLHFGHKFGFFVLVFATDDVLGKVRDRGGYKRKARAKKLVFFMVGEERRI